MKRIISLLLALVMLVGIVPFQVFAEGEPAKPETEVKVENQKEIEEENQKPAEKPEAVEEKTEENKILQNQAKETEELELGPEIQEDPVGEEIPADANVTLVGQWINDSSEKKDTPKHYEMTDTIGKPEYNSGLLRGLAKQFLCWSDKEPVGNAVLADGARIFSPEDKISDVFPNGIPEDAKIYAVYYEINNPYGKPFPKDALTLVTVGKVLDNLKGRVNSNSLSINEKVGSEDTLKDTKNYKAEDTIVDYYEKKDDVNNINEVVLKSEFQMDWAVAMLAYRNMTGSNSLRPILSFYYNKRYKGNEFAEKNTVALEKPADENKINNFPISDSIGEYPKNEKYRDPGYTYVDLNMDFGTDEGLVIPDNLFLEFKSYSWRPLCAFGIKEDGTKDILNILGTDETPKGNKPDAFKDLVSGEKPETKFGVETKGYRKITVRVVLREWDNSVKKPHQNPFSGERIPESKIPKGPDGTIASEILSNMTLRALGSDDGIKKENIVRISDKRAKELADGEGKDDIKITGSIKGHVFASASFISAYGFDFPLMSDIPIKLLESKNTLKLSYVHKPEPQPQPQPQAKPEERSGGLKFNFSAEEIEKHIAYIFGYEDNTVRANGNLTRAEAAAMVTRLAKLDLSNTSKADYKDLEDNAWYLPYINAALKAGMLDAEDNNLRPNENISRGEFAKMLAAVDKDNDYVSNFSDVKGHKYEKEINKIDGNKRIEGYEDGSFRPDAFLTRAEAATFLNRMYNRVADDLAIESFKNSIAHFKDLNKDDWFYYEIVEASNTHELTRRGSHDKYRREFEKWTNLIK